MRIIRLNRAEFSRHRVDQILLVDDETGVFVRNATEKERERLLLARKRGQEIKFKTNEGRILKAASDRQRLYDELLERHGDCQLRRTNGTLLKVLRDPNRERPTATSQQGAPDPERCECARWHGRDSGRHHKLCKWNALAKPEHKALEPVEDTVVDTGSLVEDADPSPPPPPAQSSSDVALSPKDRAPSYPPPLECECRKQGWQMREGDDPDGHHFMCKYFEAWKADQGAEYLFTLEGEKVRMAMPAEIKEAEEGLRARGTRTCRVEDEEYLVRFVKKGEELVEEPADTADGNAADGNAVDDETSDTEPPPAAAVDEAGNVELEEVQA